MSESFKEFFKTIMIGIALAIVCKFFVADVVHVRGESMEPTIQDKDMMVMEKISYYLHEPKIGDIVIVAFDDQEEKLIKRVVAIAGDEIAIKDGVLYRNEKKIKEPYIRSIMTDGDQEKVEIPEGYVYVMGDNRNHSADSRAFGPVKIENIDGKVGLEIKDDFLKFY